MAPELRKEIADILGLPETDFPRLRVGFNPHDYHGPCWTFPEVDVANRIVGITRRYRDGKKKSEDGGKHGLFVPIGWNNGDGPICSPEGPTDTLSLAAMDISAVGRPSNMAGVEELAAFLKEIPSQRPIIILGEWDPKENGTWPGRDGAVKVANELVQKLGRPINWALPPKGSKDVRAWPFRKHFGKVPETTLIVA